MSRSVHKVKCIYLSIGPRTCHILPQ